MPSLNWIGKEAVTNHDKEVPFRLLKKIKTASVGDESQNLIIHGDNLEGLKALMPYYAGKIKCIYIDPPYNTGNQSWIYNDKVNSPKIKHWLGKVVGKESEDLTRHDKWLCMMYPRLKLLRDLLSDDGVIYISLDYHEFHNLRMIMDEIFGENNFLANLIWRGMHTVRNSSKDFNQNTEYIVTFAKNKEVLIKAGRPETYLRYPTDKTDSYPHDDNDGNGPYKLDPIYARNFYKPYEYKFKNGVVWSAPKGAYPRYSQESLREMDEQGKIVFTGKDPKAKRYLKDVQEGVPPNTLLPVELVGFNKDGTSELAEIFGDQGKMFDQPKPTSLIKWLMRISRKIDSQDYIVLDSFAGSGTTAQAVLDLNNEDGGNRKFILVEMEDYAKDITAERVKRVIKKHDYKDGFEYCELDKPLFNETGHIETTCDFNQFATYIYFTETQRNIDKKDIDGNFIGEDGTSEFYLIYKEPKTNDLDKTFIKKLKKTEGKKVVYADRCMLDDETLAQYNIVFKQIPYEVKIY